MPSLESNSKFATCQEPSDRPTWIGFANRVQIEGHPKVGMHVQQTMAAACVSQRRSSWLGIRSGDVAAGPNKERCNIHGRRTFRKCVAGGIDRDRSFASVGNEHAIDKRQLLDTMNLPSPMAHIFLLADDTIPR